MKRPVALICLLLLAGYPALLQAQKGAWNAGVEGGPGLSIIYGDNSIYSHSTFSFGGAAGVFGEYRVARNFSAKAAIHYERKGARIDNQSVLLPAGGQQQFNLDYISVPLLAKWITGRKFQFFVNAGPCISFLLQQSTWYIPESGDKYEIADEKDAYSPIDLSVTAGAGVSMALGKKLSISVEVRDNFGLLNIRTSVSQFERDSYLSAGETRGYTNSALLLLGVAYRIGGGGSGLPCTPGDPDFQYIRKK